MLLLAPGAQASGVAHAALAACQGTQWVCESQWRGYALSFAGKESSTCFESGFLYFQNQMGGNLLASQPRVAIPRKLWQSGTYTLLLWSFHKKTIWSFHKRSRSGASTALKEALRAFTKGADLDLPQKEPIGSFCCGSFCGWADLDPKAADVEPPQKEPIWSPMRHDRPHAP